MPSSGGVSRVKSGPTEADLLRVTRLSLPIRLFALAAALVLPATAFAGADDDGPKAATLSVTAVTQGSAQLSGTITLGKKDASYAFQYWTTPTNGRFTATETATHAGDNSDHRKNVSGALTGLAIGTTYHVRLLAWYEDYEDYVASPSTTFTTTGTPAAPEPGGTAAPGATPTGASPASKAAELGATVALTATAGVIRVNTPGAGGFVALDDLTALPVGTVVNASRGTVELQSALPNGTTQTGTFYGSRFKIRQSAEGNGRVNLHLRGGNLDGCSARSGSVAQASAAAKPKRRLWGSDSGGRFRTHGRDSVATVRGTRWSVTDRCDGTLTRVTEGAVDVRVRATGRVTRVAAGERHFARHQR